MRHFLPKHSSSAAASIHLKHAPTQQPGMSAPAAPIPQPAKTQQMLGRSRSASIFLICRSKSRHCRTAHQTASLKPHFTPFISGCRGKCICCEYRVHTSVQATAYCNSGGNKTQTFSKREQDSSSVPHECPSLVQSVTRVYSTPCHVGRRLAGHSGVSEWVMCSVVKNIDISINIDTEISERYQY